MTPLVRDFQFRNTIKSHGTSSGREGWMLQNCLHRPPYR